MAGNQCIDALRRRKRGRQVIVEVEEGVEVIEPASSEPSPLGAVLSTEERVQVRDAIARLPENYRMPLVLRYYGELSYDEIAQQLGLQRNYVAALKYRAKQELRLETGPQEQVIMECYSEQIVAIFVDGELPTEEARHLRDHLATCRRCRQLLDALRAENRVLSESLQELPEEATIPAGFSRWPRSVAWGDVAVVAAVLAEGAIVVPWINEAERPRSAALVKSFQRKRRHEPDLQPFLITLQTGGTAMLSDYVAFVGKILLLLLLGGSALLLSVLLPLRQPGLRLLIVLLALSLPGFALERRHSEFVRVSGERDCRRHSSGLRQHCARGRRGQWGLAGFWRDGGSAWHCQGRPGEFCQENRGERNCGRQHLQPFEFPRPGRATGPQHLRVDAILACE